jgi:predicted dehydrogenase
VTLVFRFKHGAIGSGIVSDAVPAPWSYELTSGESSAYPHYREQNCYIFAGTKGSLTFPQMRVWHYPPEQPSGWYHPLTQYQIEVDRIDPLLAQLDHFLAVIRAEASPLVSAQDGLQTLVTTLAVRESAQRNVPINL